MAVNGREFEVDYSKGPSRVYIAIFQHISFVETTTWTLWALQAVKLELEEDCRADQGYPKWWAAELPFSLTMSFSLVSPVVKSWPIRPLDLRRQPLDLGFGKEWFLQAEPLFEPLPSNSSFLCNIELLGIDAWSLFFLRYSWDDLFQAFSQLKWLLDQGFVGPQASVRGQLLHDLCCNVLKHPIR